MRIAFTLSDRPRETPACIAARLQPLFDLTQATGAVVWEGGGDTYIPEVVHIEVAGRRYYRLSTRPGDPFRSLRVQRVTDEATVSELRSLLSGPHVYDTANLAAGEAGAGIMEGHPCPRCGCSLLTDGVQVWCTFVGGHAEPACAFGLDLSVSVREYHDDPSNHRRPEPLPCPPPVSSS